MKRTLQILLTAVVSRIGWSYLNAQTTSWPWLNLLAQGSTLHAGNFVDANIGTAVGSVGTIHRSTNGELYGC